MFYLLLLIGLFLLFFLILKYCLSDDFDHIYDGVQALRLAFSLTLLVMLITISSNAFSGEKDDNWIKKTDIESSQNIKLESGILLLEEDNYIRPLDLKGEEYFLEEEPDCTNPRIELRRTYYEACDQLKFWFLLFLEGLDVDYKTVIVVPRGKIPEYLHSLENQ